MISSTTFFTTFSVVAGVAVAVPAQEPTNFLDSRQSGSFVTSNWQNDYSTVTYDSGPAGQFTLDWDNGPFGDFVIGKGYKGGNM